MLVRDRKVPEKRVFVGIVNSATVTLASFANRRAPSRWRKWNTGRENFAASRDKAKDDRKSEKNHSREDEFKPGGWMPTPRNFRRRARGELLLFNPLYRTTALGRTYRPIMQLAVASGSQLPVCPSYDQNPGVVLSVLDRAMARIGRVPRSLPLLLPGLSLVIQVPDIDGSVH